jgi:hypothetical protein
METRHSGLLFPSKGPTFLPTLFVSKWDSHFWLSSSILAIPQEPAALIDLLRYRNIQVPQHMLHFRFPQA